MASGASDQQAMPLADRVARRPPPRRARRRSRRLRVLVPGLAGCVAALVAVVVLARPLAGVPAGVRVDGVAVGGRTTASARALLERSAADTIARGLIVSAGSRRLRLRLRALRVSPDIDGALHVAAGAYGPLDRIAVRVGLGKRLAVPLRYRFDQRALDRALTPLARAVQDPPLAAGVTVGRDGTLTLVPGHGGVLIDRSALRNALARLPALNGHVELPLRRVAASASTASARAAMAAARTLLATPHAFVLGGVRYPVSASALRAALGFEVVAGRLRLALTRPAIAAETKRIFGSAELQPENARFTVDARRRVEIVPSKDGRVVDADAARALLTAHPGGRDVPVRIAGIHPAFTTADARLLGVSDEVSEFTTPYEPGAPRVTNIQRAAEILDGTILKAGETFSLNDALGQRTIENGFVTAPMIDEGRLRDAVGGGVSQVATTLYNAAFFAGLKLVAHTPHEFWISRYPQGREATVSWGGPELVFQNDWSAPLVIIVEARSDHITVRFFSRQLGRRVEQGIDPPTSTTDATVRRIVNPALPPRTENVLQQGGQQGFSVSYWRRVYAGSRLRSSERFDVVYHPEDTIVEVGPTPPPKPPPRSTTTGATTATTSPASGSTAAGSGSTAPSPPTTTGTP